jgi:hypothetical protein
MAAACTSLRLITRRPSSYVHVPCHSATFAKKLMMVHHSTERQLSPIYPKYKPIPCLFVCSKKSHASRGRHCSYVVCSMADHCLYCSVQHEFSDVHQNHFDMRRKVTIGWKNRKIKWVKKRI